MPMIGPTSNHKEIRVWADRNSAIPAEVLPHHIDGEPALLRLMLAAQVEDHADLRAISWEEFFLKFDSLGLALVYDDQASGYNEILQIEESSVSRSMKTGQIGPES
jgi:hypothetical protein